MGGPAVPHRHDKKFADLYGNVRVVERGDGYFFIEQPRDPEDSSETHDVVCFSCETARKIHDEIGKWLVRSESK